jgi:hypothetical protein
MCKHFVVVALLIAASGFAGANQADDVKAGGVITKLGEYKAFDGKLTLKVAEADGKLTLNITPSSRPKSNFALSLPSKKDAFWLVYPETANKVWFFRTSDLVEWELTDQGTNTTTSTGQGVLKAAPSALLDALPKEVLDKLKSK